MSTFLDFAIGLSLVNGISGQVQNIISDFRKLDGVTDDMMGKLSDFKNISITGGLLAGAGVAGLTATKDALDDCISEAEKLQSISTTLEIKAFGKDLLNESKLPEIKAQMEALTDNAMDISLNTVFNTQQIEESMVSMIKGGMSKEMVAGGGAEANAYFAQINGVDAKATADATVKFAAGFQLDETQIKESLDLITRYSDASIADALAIQQNIGNAAGSAMSVWKNRDNMKVAEETIQLVAATKYITGDESTAATNTRNFLDEAGKTYDTMTAPQIQMMTNAGWLSGEESIFIDYNTGMLKSAAELEKILEDTAQRMDAVDFNNLLDIVFGDRGKKTAQALAQQGGATDLSTLQSNAGNQLGIDEQVARQMETAAAQVGIFEESINTLKATLGTPFLEGKAAMFKQFNQVLAQVTGYFKEHPEVTKFMAAIAAGVSAFLLLIGTIMLLIGLFGSLKLVLSVAGPQIAAFFMPVLPVLATVIAVVGVIAGLAYVIYKNWDRLRPQFESIMGHVSQILETGKRAFCSFLDAILPILSEILSKAEQGALWIISVVLPVIDTGLSMIVDLLNGDFSTAWESLPPLGRILMLAFGPVLLGIGAMLAIMTVKILACAAATGVLAVAEKGIAAVTLIWKGIMAVAAAAQLIWNVAMGHAVAYTFMEKALCIGFLPVILAIKAAKLIWTGVQWALNAAMAANPIGLVIIAIVALGVVIFALSKPFKELIDWVGKAWNKLKSFLGFKNEAKEELEEPINVTVNKGGEEVVIPNTPENTQTSLVLQSIQPIVRANPILQGEGISQFVQQNIDTTNIPVEVIPYLQNAGMSDEEIIQTLGLPEDYQIPVGLQISGMGNEQVDKILQQYVPQIDLSELQAQAASMNVLGADGAGQLADGMASEEALQALGVSMDSVNGAITNGLIQDEQMRTFGVNLIQAFIDGMNSKTEALRVAMQGIASVIGDYMAVHSPTKAGPLHTNQLWGGNLIQSFIDGMNGKASALDHAVADTAGRIQGINSDASWTMPVAYQTGANKGNTDNGNAEKEKSPIYIMIQSNGKNEKEIAAAVARELERRGIGEKKVGIDSSLTMSPYGYRMGY